MFTILVGPEKKKYQIHSALLACQSSALKALVENDRFKEAETRSVTWEDVQESTFVSFFQFVYGEDYVTPKTIQRGPAEVDEVDAPAPSFDNWLSREFVKKEDREKAGGENYAQHPEPRGLSVQEAYVPAAPKSYPFQGRDSDNYLIHHARVFVLADRYLVERLKILAYAKPSSELARCEIVYGSNDEAVIRKVDFLGYCLDGLEVLENIAMMDVALDFKRIWDYPYFQELLEENEGLLAMLITRVVPKIRS